MIIAYCPACGQSNPPNAKFCRHCGISLAVSSQPMPESVSTPPPQEGLPVCKSCGKIVAPEETYCRYCGASLMEVDRDIVPSDPSSSPQMCLLCGTATGPEMKFCGACGRSMAARAGPGDPAPESPVSAPAAAPVESPADFTTVQSHAGGEETVIGVIGNAKKKKWFSGSYDTSMIVVTSRRMIFARQTTALANAAIMEAQIRAKAENTKFSGTVQDRVTASFGFALRYERMSPDKALAETPGNVAIQNSRISAIKIHPVESGNTHYPELKIIIKSKNGKFAYTIAEDERFTNLLKTMYGDRLHMPSGYFSKPGVRIQFF